MPGSGRGYPSTVTDVPQPALATLSHHRSWEDGWIYERKLDGQRCLAVRDRRGTRLYSRSGRDVTVAFPEIAEALEQQAATDFVVDGEVVAFEGSRTSFSRLQPRIHVSSAEKARRSGVAVYFYAFDVLRADGTDVRREQLLDRKRILRGLLGWDDPIRYTPHRVHGGEEWFAEICGKGWEGLIAKRADASYSTGRTKDWLKFKCESGQELVVVGWTDPEGSRVALGALLLGHHRGEGLVYAGKVGTGFSAKVLRDLHTRLNADRARHLTVHGRPTPPRRRALGGARARRPDRLHRVDECGSAAPPPLPGAADRQEREGRGARMTETVAGVEVSKPDKELLPGVSKLDLARYYDSVADAMLPFLRGRPINMQRFPDGIDGPSFYEKKVPAHFPEWVRTVEVDTADGPQRQVLVADRRSLVYLAQQACLTPHTWLSTADHLDRPDQLVIDLDPSDDDLAKVRRATRMTGDLLDELGLTPYLRTTGSRGYHVVVPLRPEEDFDEVRAFARSVAERLVERDPDLLTLEARKAKRGDRVLVDIMRNGYGQTAVPSYAVRARPGAPVATPLAWDELSEVEPQGFTVASLPRRLAEQDDPWHGWRRHASGLGRARGRL